MITLARALRDGEGIGSVFAVNGSEDALAPIIQAGFEARLLSSPTAALGEVVNHPDICILDCRDRPSRQDIAHFAEDIPVRR